MATNIYRQFLELLPPDPLLIGQVTALVPGGAYVRLPDGAGLRVRGDASVGQMVFVKSGAIQGIAPQLQVVEIDV